MIPWFAAFYFRGAGRSKQTASKENESSEEMDVFQSSSPVHDIPQEITMEEEDVSSIRVNNIVYAQLHIDSFEWLCISYC